MWEALGIAVAGLGAWFVVDALRAREAATHIARQACMQHGLQLLDDTVQWPRLRLARDAEGIARLRRTFVFEFSDDGFSRRWGSLVMLGQQLESVQLEPYWVS